MEFYEESFVPFGLCIDWDYWKRMPTASLNDLCYLAFGINPVIINKYFDYIEMQEEHLESLNQEYSKIAVNSLEISSEQQEIMDSYQQDMQKTSDIIKDGKREKKLIERRVGAFRDLAISHLEAGILSAPFDICVVSGTVSAPSSTILASSLNISDFVHWLKKQKIPFPKQMNNCFGVSSKKEEKLTAGQKSSLTQENTVLKRMFKELVKLHYGDNATSYAIAKDLTADAQTIKKHLDSSK